MLGNAFLVEAVFAWPGLSRYGVEVILRKDLNAIVGTVLIIAALFLIVNIIVDLLVAFINPRIRLAQRACDEVRTAARAWYRLPLATRCRCSAWSSSRRSSCSSPSSPISSRRSRTMSAPSSTSPMMNKPPDGAVSVRHRPRRPRPLHPHRLRLPPLADPRRRGAGDRRADRRRRSGLLAGYLGGWIEYVLMRITDVFLSIPPLVLAMSIMGVLEPTLTNGMIAVTAMWWPWYARLVYNLTRSEKRRGLCARRRSDRRLDGAHHVPRDPAELRAVDPHQDDARPRLRHPDRLVAVLPRPRRAAADAGPRLDGRRRRQIPAGLLVADGLPRPRDPGRRVRLQPGRRRACAKYLGAEQ